MCAGDLDFIYATDAVGVPYWAKTAKGRERSGTIERRNFPKGKKRSNVKHVREERRHDDQAALALLSSGVRLPSR